MAKGMFAQLKEMDQQPDKNVAKEELKVESKPVLQPEVKKAKANCQLNAWISSSQATLLDKVYFRLRSNGTKLKKGEVVGVAIEVLSRILENQSPVELNSTILDSYKTNEK